MAEENGCFGLTFASTRKDVEASFCRMGVDAWIGSVMPLIRKGVSFEVIKSLGAQGVYDLHRAAVADGQIEGKSPRFAGHLNKAMVTVRI